MSSRKTSVEINEERLNTVEEVFHEGQRALARREEVEALSTMRGMDLMDPTLMSQAWHS